MSNANTQAATAAALLEQIRNFGKAYGSEALVSLQVEIEAVPGAMVSFYAHTAEGFMSEASDLFDGEPDEEMLEQLQELLCEAAGDVDKEPLAEVVCDALRGAREAQLRHDYDESLEP